MSFGGILKLEGYNIFPHNFREDLDERYLGTLLYEVRFVRLG